MSATTMRPRDPEWPSAREMAELHYRSARRAINLYGWSLRRSLGRIDDHPIFIVGSPRSGTTFMASVIGSVDGFADLGELLPWKRLIPHLYSSRADEGVPKLLRILSLAQRLGQVGGMSIIEQTPESSFMIETITRAYPKARFVHMIRDGRDVAASLIGLGWLRAAEINAATDDVGHAFGHGARFWVEPDRRAEFSAANEAKRAAWVWRRYESVASKSLGLSSAAHLEVRYEALLKDPAGVAVQLAKFLSAEDRESQFKTALARTNCGARGRWSRDLDQSQIGPVLAEAGELLSQRGYRD